MAIALFGSGEFTDAVDGIDAYLISTYAPKNIAIIPAAAGAERDAGKWLAMAREHYKKFELAVIDVPVFSPDDANDPAKAGLLNDCDWIFFSGGDPYYLLRLLTGSLVWDNVKERIEAGALIAGSSAGAMVLGSYVLTNPLKAIVLGDGQTWKPGFSVVDFAILPHFNRMSSHASILKRLLKNAPKDVRDAWVGIDEDTAVIIDGDNRSIHGLGSVDFNL